MPQLFVPLLLILAVLFATNAQADRSYKVYKSNEFGRKDSLAQPEAIIEVDDFTGEARVYEPDIFGRADTLRGPKYIIESDSVSVGLHEHLPLQELLDDDDRYQRRRAPYDYEECDEE